MHSDHKTVTVVVRTDDLVITVFGITQSILYTVVGDGGFSCHMDLEQDLAIALHKVKSNNIV